MPLDTSIKSVLVIGSGPIVIGQACEFDYSGTQACRVLRAEGIRVILVNSNPATIMTDPEFADATYIEPITWQVVEKIIEKEVYITNDEEVITLGKKINDLTNELTSESKGLRIFFSHRPDNIVSNLIAKFQGGISHVGFRFFMFKVWLWEAKGHGGLSYSDPTDFMQKAVIVEEYEIMWTDAEKAEALRIMDTLLRQTYGFLGVLGMSVVLIAKKLGGWTLNPFPWGFFCSQAVYRIMTDVFKVYIDNNPDENRVGPEDLKILLQELVMTSPEKFKRIK